MVDFAKDTGQQVVNWTALAAGTSGNTGDITLTNDLASILHIDMAATAAVAITAGSEAECVVHIKSGTTDEFWLEFARFKMDGGTILDSSTDDTVDSTEVALKVASTTGFITHGQVLFMKDSTLTNSEIVQIKDVSVDDSIEATEPFTRDHANSTTYIYDHISQWNVLIPKTISTARVTFHTGDDDATYAYRVRYTQVTDIG
jgi:hypothetical protein